METQEVIIDPVQQAKEILKQEEERKINAFIKEYSELVQKHGFEIKPKSDLIVVAATPQS